MEILQKLLNQSNQGIFAAANLQFWTKARENFAPFTMFALVQSKGKRFQTDFLETDWHKCTAQVHSRKQT